MKLSRSNGVTLRSATESVSAGMCSLALGWFVALYLHIYIRSCVPDALCLTNILLTGSFATRRAHRSSIHTSQREARVTSAAVRTSHLQTTMPLCAEPLLVSMLPPSLSSITAMLTAQLARSTFGRAFGSAPSACPAMPCPHTTRTSLPTRFLPNCIPQTPQSSTGWHAPPRALRSSYMSSTCAKRRTAWPR